MSLLNVNPKAVIFFESMKAEAALGREALSMDLHVSLNPLHLIELDLLTSGNVTTPGGCGRAQVSFGLQAAIESTAPQPRVLISAN